MSVMTSSPGIDERDDVLARNLDYRHTQGDSHLWRREPHSTSRPQRVYHVVDELQHRRVYEGNLLGGFPQHRIGDRTNLASRHVEYLFDRKRNHAMSEPVRTLLPFTRSFPKHICMIHP